MTDFLPDCPRISTKARTIVHSNEREVEDIPVLEPTDTLEDMIRGTYGHTADEMYLIESDLFPTVAVIAEHEQAAWDTLADAGVLDSLQVSQEEAESRPVMRLGNAGQPFDIDQTYVVVSKFTVNDIVHFHQRLTFNCDGWMHLWQNNRHNENPPFVDVCVQVDEDLDVSHMFVPNGEDMSDEPIKFAQYRVDKHIWSLINEHC